MSRSFYQKFLLFLIVIVASYSFSQPTNNTLCVQSLNTHSTWYAEDLEDRHLHLLSFLKNQTCDIVLLQEVWLHEHYENIKRLSLSLPLKVIHFDHTTNTSYNSGLMSLINKPLLDQGIQYFPRQHTPQNLNIDWFQRTHSLITNIAGINKGFGFVSIRHHTSLGDIPILFVNLHLNHLSQQHRVLELLFYLHWLVSSPYKQYVIVTGGDFNFQPDSLEFEIVKYMLRLKDPFIELNKNHGCTHFCHNNQDAYYLLQAADIQPRTLDYIFFNHSPTIGVNPVVARVFPKSYNQQTLSDHYGINVEIEFYKKEHSTVASNQTITDFLTTINKVEALLTNKPHSIAVDCCNSYHQLASSLSFFQRSYANTSIDTPTDAQIIISSLKKQAQELDSPLLQYLLRNP